jgi:predicted dienelactone hydrolase
MTPRPLLLAMALVVTVAGACSDDDASPATTASVPAEATTTLEPPEREPDPAEVALAHADRGDHPVGVTTLERDGGHLVEVWYPAVEGTTGTETYDMRDFTPPAIRDLLTGDVPATSSHEAGRDAEVADGAFPIVLFSHGFTGMRLQSTFLTAHLASHGMIVVSTDHPSRDLLNVLGGTAADASQDATADVLEALDLILAEGDRADGPFDSRVDPTRVAVVGHSAGGATALHVAADARISSYISLASGAFGFGPADPPELPDTPSFFIAGALDAVVPPDERTRPAFQAAPSPSRLWIIDRAGHNAFTDFCTFGDGTGIIGVAEASGLGAFLDTQPQFRALGQDGCLEPNVPVEEVFPIIRHAVTAELRYRFGIDPEPVGLGVEVADQYSVSVEIDEK